jgi:hypothetical protein
VNVKNRLEWMSKIGGSGCQKLVEVDVKNRLEWMSKIGVSGGHK